MTSASDSTSNTMKRPTATDPVLDTWFGGHPRGLATLFFTEMWERFSYYGMRALLILFMTANVVDGGLGFDVARAGAIYGLYTAAVYLTALPGGWLADRIIGQQRAVLAGGITIAAGHFTMALPAVTEVAGTMGPFYSGLFLIVIGTGLLKPNVSTLVGELYPEGDVRRDAGFSIFYMGINLGAFAAPLVTSYLGERIDWHLGFAAAGVGMVIGVIQYVTGRRYLGGAGLRPEILKGERSLAQRRLVIAAAATLILFLVLLQSFGVADLRTAVGVAGASGVILLAITAVYFASILLGGELDRKERRRVGVIALLFLFSALFWSGFEQAGSSLNLFARDLTDRVIFGWEMPAGYLQSINALCIILFAPIFAWLWVRLARAGREPSTPAKFAFGLFSLGLGFVVMTIASMRALGGEAVSPGWLVTTYLLHSIGELALSPVGLSTVTKLAPRRMAGQLMGIWFLSISVGNLMAGQVAGLYASLPLPRLFGAIALTMAFGGVVLLVMSGWMRGRMGGVR